MSKFTYNKYGTKTSFSTIKRYYPKNKKKNMANSDNQCSDLKVEDHYKNTKDTFGMIYNKQKELQERLGMNYKDLTLKEIAEIWEPKNKFKIWLQIEILICEALSKKGIIPEKSLKIIKKKAKFDILQMIY